MFWSTQAKEGRRHTARYSGAPQLSTYSCSRAMEWNAYAWCRYRSREDPLLTYISVVWRTPGTPVSSTSHALAEQMRHALHAPYVVPAGASEWLFARPFSFKNGERKSPTVAARKTKALIRYADLLGYSRGGSGGAQTQRTSSVARVPRQME